MQPVKTTGAKIFIETRRENMCCSVECGFGLPHYGTHPEDAYIHPFECRFLAANTIVRPTFGENGVANAAKVPERR